MVLPIDGEHFMITKLAFWVAFFAFVAAALATGWHPRLLAFDGAGGFAKAIVVAAWVGFVAYSFYCSQRENLFKTIGTMASLHWGRQIGLDLYISLALSVVFIYLHTGSGLVAAAWLVPVLVYANQAVLLYVVINFEQIVARLA